MSETSKCACNSVCCELWSVEMLKQSKSHKRSQRFVEKQMLQPSAVKWPLTDDQLSCYLSRGWSSVVWLSWSISGLVPSCRCTYIYRSPRWRHSLVRFHTLTGSLCTKCNRLQIVHNKQTVKCYKFIQNTASVMLFYVLREFCVFSDCFWLIFFRRVGF